MVKIVCVSDIHCQYKDIKIPECDILLSCGDYTHTGKPNEVEGFHLWMNKQPAKHKISGQGNHELWVEDNFVLAKEIATKACPGVYFIDEGLIEVEGIKIWYSAITPWFYDWAWNRNRGADIKKHWDRIPNDIQILATHGPAMGYVDQVDSGEHVGCLDLTKKIYEIKPKYHVCGHIHPAYGKFIGEFTTFINASICDESYQPTREPIIIEI